MKPSTLSERIKGSNTTNKNVENITQKFGSLLDLKDTAQDVPHASKSGPLEADDEEDWEKLADKELETPEKPAAKSTPPPGSDGLTILELYDFDPKMQMHQIVKAFTTIVDPTRIMPFRPKMVNDSLLLVFNNPKHATAILYNYSCVTPMNPVGKLRRSDGTTMSRSSSSNSLPSMPYNPPRMRSTSPSSSSRPLTTDSVARRFIASHLGVQTTTSPERKEYDKMVRQQAQQQKLEREKQRRKEKEDQGRREEEIRDVWEKG